MKIGEKVPQFIEYRRSARNNSENTLRAYRTDLLQVAAFLEEKGAANLDEIQIASLRAYFVSLQSRGDARATLARKQAALRSFFRWAKRTGAVQKDPTHGLRAPRQYRSLPKF